MGVSKKTAQELKNKRIGEQNTNNYGSLMKIISYKDSTNIDVLFVEHDCVVKNKYYCEFKRGTIISPYDKTVYNIGYIGETNYPIGTGKGKYKGHSKCYNSWKNMFTRCYDKNEHKRNPNYIGCLVDSKWYNFTNFVEWFKKNYYEVAGEKMHLDKDILLKNNKIYSENTCIFAPQFINDLFVKSNKIRGDLPIGITYHKKDKKYQAQCKNIYGKSYLGQYDTMEKAFKVYKEFKESYIKQIAEEYKWKIPKKLYDAMCNWKVEIKD